MKGMIRYEDVTKCDHVAPKTTTKKSLQDDLLKMAQELKDLRAILKK